MHKNLLAAAMFGGLAAGLASMPASALPMVHPMGADAGGSRAEPVARYCNKRGECIKVKRPGFSYRAVPVVRSCGPGWRWNGYSCTRRPGVVLKGPNVKIKIRP